MLSGPRPGPREKQHMCVPAPFLHPASLPLPPAALLCVSRSAFWEASPPPIRAHPTLIPGPSTPLAASLPDKPSPAWARKLVAAPVFEKGLSEVGRSLRGRSGAGGVQALGGWWLSPLHAGIWRTTGATPAACTAPFRRGHAPYQPWFPPPGFAPASPPAPTPTKHPGPHGPLNAQSFHTAKLAWSPANCLEPWM